MLICTNFSYIYYYLDNDMLEYIGGTVTPKDKLYLRPGLFYNRENVTKKGVSEHVSWGIIIGQPHGLGSFNTKGKSLDKIFSFPVLKEK